MVRLSRPAYSNALVFMLWNKAPFPHADFIRAIKIALQRWGSTAESLDGMSSRIFLDPLR